MFNGDELVHWDIDNGQLFVALIVVIVVAVAALVVLGRERMCLKQSWSDRALAVGSSLVVAYGILSVVSAATTAFASAMERSEDFLLAETASKELGFESGRSYPLLVEGESGLDSMLDDRSISSSGSFTVRHITDSDLSLSFRTGGESYIFKLPLLKVVFTEGNGTDSSVKIDLAGESDFMHLQQHYDGFACHLHNLIVVCPPAKPHTTIERVPGGKSRGLGELVNDHLDRVEITLTPDMYQRILGGSVRIAPIS
jgi:hypothetical protein